MLPKDAGEMAGRSTAGWAVGERREERGAEAAGVERQSARVAVWVPVDQHEHCPNRDRHRRRRRAAGSLRTNVDVSRLQRRQWRTPCNALTRPLASRDEETLGEVVHNKAQAARQMSAV